jgi:peptidoglycan/LPS O-acetylase OafA/YrhL
VIAVTGSALHSILGPCTTIGASFRRFRQGAWVSKRFYRPELDVVRFLAFLAVFLHHSLPIQPNGSWRVSFTMACGFGLCVFFALSAYLITTLLLRERAQTGTVNLPMFYKRRILRIWPLYFLALGYGVLFDLYGGRYASNPVWYPAALVMAGNMVGPTESIVGQLWSISLEEQFYVVWPSAMKYLTRRGLLIAALCIVAASNATLAYFGLVRADTWQRIWWNTLVQMEMFATGILLALFHAARGAVRRSWAVRIPGLAAIPVVWILAVQYGGIKGDGLNARGPVSLCLGFAAIAVTSAALIDLLTGLEHWPQPMIYFGKISYGLYVFHTTGVYLAEQHLRMLRHSERMVVALAFTMVAAALSYRFIETPFLRLKERFELVKSRPVE